MKSSYIEKGRAKIGNLKRGKKLGEQSKSKLKQKALMRPPCVFREQARNNLKKSLNP